MYLFVISLPLSYSIVRYSFPINYAICSPSSLRYLSYLFALNLYHLFTIILYYLLANSLHQHSTLFVRHPGLCLLYVFTISVYSMCCSSSRFVSTLCVCHQCLLYVFTVRVSAYAMYSPSRSVSTLCVCHPGRSVFWTLLCAWGVVLNTNTCYSVILLLVAHYLYS